MEHNTGHLQIVGSHQHSSGGSHQSNNRRNLPGKHQSIEAAVEAKFELDMKRIAREKAMALRELKHKCIDGTNTFRTKYVFWCYTQRSYNEAKERLEMKFQKIIDKLIDEKEKRLYQIKHESGRMPFNELVKNLPPPPYTPAI